jgi:hypothetical protein
MPISEATKRKRKMGLKASWAPNNPENEPMNVKRSKTKSIGRDSSWTTSQLLPRLGLAVFADLLLTPSTGPLLHPLL